MATNKPKKKQAALIQSLDSGPQVTELAPQPITDFDDAAFQTLCQQLDPTVKSLAKNLTSVIAATDEVAKSGVLKTLSASEHGQRLSDLVPDAEAALKAFAALLPTLRVQLDSWRTGERRTRRARFEKIAVAMNWKIVGSWPEPVVEGIVFLAVDEPKDRAIVNGRSIGSLTAERLAQQVAVELQQLKSRLADPADFIRQVWKASVARGGSPGQGVAVQDLLAELTWQRQSKAFQRDPREEAFRGYPLAQFRADLTNYLALGATPLQEAGKSYELQIVGGSFAQDGIFMHFPQTDRLSTCGRLTFRQSTAVEKP